MLLLRSLCKWELYCRAWPGAAGTIHSVASQTPSCYPSLQNNGLKINSLVENFSNPLFPTVKYYRANTANNYASGEDYPHLPLT